MLPKVQAPKFQTTLPSSGTEITFRPFINKEQKNLLIISQGGGPIEIFKGIIDLVNACTFEKYDWYSMPQVDLEWAFLNIRAKSVGEIVEMSYMCLHKNEEDIPCNEKNYIDVDIREAKSTEAPLTEITVNEDIKIFFEKLTVKDVIDLMDESRTDEIIHRLIKYVTEGEQVYTEFSIDEMKEFIDSLPKSATDSISKIFNDDPTLVLEHPTKCSKCGHESKVTIKGVLNFFG